MIARCLNFRFSISSCRFLQQSGRGQVTNRDREGLHWGRSSHSPGPAGLQSFLLRLSQWWRLWTQGGATHPSGYWVHRDEGLGFGGVWPHGVLVRTGAVTGPTQRSRDQITTTPLSRPGALSRGLSFILLGWFRYHFNALEFLSTMSNQAALSVCPSICMSVCLSVDGSLCVTAFYHIPIIRSSKNLH